MRLLADKSRTLRNLNNPISWGMKPESSFLKRYKVVKFLKLPMEGRIGPMRLLVDNRRSLRDLNNPISWGIEPESSFSKRCKVIKFLKFPIDGGIRQVRLLVDKSRKLRDLNNPILEEWNQKAHSYKGTKWFLKEILTFRSVHQRKRMK